MSIRLLLGTHLVRHLLVYILLANYRYGLLRRHRVSRRTAAPRRSTLRLSQAYTAGGQQRGHAR